MKRIAVTLIATNKYRQFVQPLLEGIEKNFLRNHKVDVHLFTNELFPTLDIGRITVIQHTIPAYRFPEATLLRYRIFSDHKEYLKNYDFLFYSDVDMEICDEVGNEILQGDVVAVRHPGFYYNNGWGSGGNDPKSKSYISEEFHKKYWAGGFQGAQADKYLQICELLAAGIDQDSNNNIMAIYHDETFFNWFLNYGISVHFPEWKLIELLPSYCMPPSLHQRQMWQIDHLPAKILCLDKNHNEIRS